MGDQDKIQELIDASENALLQKIIDRQEGALGLEELNQTGPVPTQAELARWEQALDKLEPGSYAVSDVSKICEGEYRCIMAFPS